MDGYAVLSTIKSEIRWRVTRVIMLGALNDRRVIERCLERGAHDYLTTLYELNVLKARMWHCFSDHGVARQVHEQEQLSRTLLSVDYEPLNRSLLLRHIEKLGHRVGGGLGRRGSACARPVHDRPRSPQYYNFLKWMVLPFSTRYAHSLRS